MRRIWRIFRWMLLALIVLAGGVLLLNSIDDRLDPGAKAMLDVPIEDVPRQQNLYYAALGFATLGDDPEQAGWDQAQALRQQLQAGKNIFEFLHQEPPRHLTLVGSSEELPKPGDLAGAIELLRQKPEVAERLLSDNDRLIRRYDRLDVYTRFLNPIPEGEIVMVGPEWGLMFQAKRLWLLELAREVTRGRIADAMDRLNRDASFWRRMLSEPHPGMSDKYMMMAYLRYDFWIASQLVHTAHPDAAQLDVMRRMAEPLTDAQRSMAGVWEVEFRSFALEMTAGLDYQPPQSAYEKIQRFWNNWFFLRNAGFNRFYHNTLALQKASDHPCSRYRADRAELIHTPGFGLLPFRNSAGAVLADMSVAMDLDYVSHACDLQGFQRVLSLQILLRQRNPTDVEMPEAIRDAGPEYRDPYTDGPLQWLPEQRALGFDAYSRRAKEMLPWPI